MQTAANAVQNVRFDPFATVQCTHLASTNWGALLLQAMGSFPTTVHPASKTRPDGSTMKALAWFGARDVRLIDAPVPDVTEPDDVILKVTGTTICGSDLHLYHGEIVTLQKGDILGHEVRHAHLITLELVLNSSP